MTAPTVGLAIIARNEQENLSRLLASVEGAFDRVVLLDTGSADRTLEVFQEWASSQTGLTFSVGVFEWCDDFAAARNAADRLLLWGDPQHVDRGDDPGAVDWTCWADCDDTVQGAGNLRHIAAAAAPSTGAMVFDYDYAHHPQTGECICILKRERLVRAAAACNWRGHVHEAQIIEGAQQLVGPQHVLWRHHKQDVPEAAGKSNSRNLRILRDWVKTEPENPRVLAYLGTELALSGKPARIRRAIGYYKRYLKLHSDWDDERAQVCRRLGVALIAGERFDEAQTYALQALAVAPRWPDSYLTLGEVALARQEPGKALIHARMALDIGLPSQSLLILNPLDYVSHPHRLMAGAHGQMSEWDQAIECCDRVLAHEPGDTGIHQARAEFAHHARREHTAQTYVIAARQLVAADEQVKALTLLEHCVPHFATDHPTIVQARSELRERLVWLHDGYVDHYQTGGSKPEDFHDDETSNLIAEQLPRVRFLLDGLAEQAAA